MRTISKVCHQRSKTASIEISWHAGRSSKLAAIRFRSSDARAQKLYSTLNVLKSSKLSPKVS
ncbi:hypothetical protein IMZ48_24490 [Candidatus Bathyarchaeota archaeon]|nr:hypothetical protein [Candidatus Bathyarchaeota archaeon]